MTKTIRVLLLMSAVVTQIGLSAVNLRGQTLRAAVVHGSALEHPVLIATPGSDAGCLWGSTYNLRAAMPDLPPDTTGKSLVLSFFTEQDWDTLVVRGRRDPGALKPEEARFHTRVLLGDGSHPPIVGIRKALGLGPFESGHSLHAIGELYLSTHRLPTRIDALGTPTVRRFSAEELARVDPNSLLRACFGSPGNSLPGAYRLPRCFC